MVGRRDRAEATAIVVAATAAYAANCALGTAVAARLVDTSRFRWVHHLLYVVTCATTAVALVCAWRSRTGRRAAIALAPAVVPLAVIPYAGTRGRRHPLIALAAAPFYLASVASSLLTLDRK